MTLTTGANLYHMCKALPKVQSSTTGAKLDPMRIVLSGSVHLVARFLEVLPFSLSPSYN